MQRNAAPLKRNITHKSTRKKVKDITGIYTLSKQSKIPGKKKLKTLLKVNM